MSELLFAAIADDDTGATDLAGMLAEQGLRVILVIGLPSSDQLAAWASGHEAVIVATATRALPPHEAYERTREALLLLKALRPRTIEFKYCSTFDSTAQGNIGPSIDAAFDVLGIDFTVALPALPINGRTTYNGYHYVHGQLISDSPMRSHPLNPMTNPNLVAHLQSQTARRVGLASYHVVSQGAEALKAHLRGLWEQGVAIAVLDCLDNTHLATICESIAGIRFITGSSAPGIGLPPVWRKLGWWRPTATGYALPRAVSKAGCLFVAGSCSEATRGQNRWLLGQGVAHALLDPRQLLEGWPEEQAATVSAQLSEGRSVLITTASERAAAQGKSAEATGLEISRALACFTRRVLDQQMPAGLIVAGGETASALCRELGFGALRVGANIEPGVPLCYSLSGFQLPVVLKSGNFGSEDFYGRAERAIRQ